MPIVELGDRLLVARDDPVQERDIRAGIVGVLHVSTQTSLRSASTILSVFGRFAASSTCENGAWVSG